MLKNLLRAILAASFLFGATQAIILSVGTIAVNRQILGYDNAFILFLHMFILYFPVNLFLAILSGGAITLLGGREKASLHGKQLKIRLFVGMFCIHLFHFFITRFEQAQQIFGRDHYLSTIGVIDLVGLFIILLTLYLGLVSIFAPLGRTSKEKPSRRYRMLALSFSLLLFLFLLNRNDEGWEPIADLGGEAATAASAVDCYRPSTEGAPDSSGLKLIVVGLDGLDWRVLLDLISHGQLPGFCEVVRNGSIGYLENNGNYYSPIIWNTIYTGMPREVHGIGDFLKFRFFGIPEQISYFPMVAHNDHLFDFKRVFSAFDDYNRVTRMLITRPQDLLSPAIWSVLESQGARVLRNGRRNLDEAARLNPQMSREELEVERLTIDLQMASAEESDVLIYYSHYLVDDPCHADWNFLYKDQTFYDPDPAATREAQYGTAIRNAYLGADRVISTLLDSVPDARLIIVSDHGWTFNGYEHFNAPDGIVIFYGNGIAEGRERTGANVYDIFPTILYLMDLPVPLDIPGKPLIEILTDPHAVATTESYRHIVTEDSNETVGDPQELEDLKEKMKAMGYL